jgi:hypothetical protein
MGLIMKRKTMAVEIESLSMNKNFYTGILKGKICLKNHNTIIITTIMKDKVEDTLNNIGNQTIMDKDKAETTETIDKMIGQGNIKIIEGILILNTTTIIGMIIANEIIEITLILIKEEVVVDTEEEVINSSIEDEEIITFKIDNTIVKIIIGEMTIIKVMIKKKENSD